MGIGKLLLGYLLDKNKEPKPLSPEEEKELSNKIAQNQIWGQTGVASGLPYDEYSPFANPESQTMGQTNMPYPNFGLPQQFMGYPGERMDMVRGIRTYANRGPWGLYGNQGTNDESSFLLKLLEYYLRQGLRRR